MTEIIVTRGIPASGKSTWAMEWLRESPDSRGRINRDDIRAQVFGAIGEHYAPYFTQPDLHKRESLITSIEEKMAEQLLKTRAIVVDATHIKASHIRRWAELANRLSIPFSIKLFDTPLDVCLERDAAREWPVGEKVIRDMYARLQNALRDPLDFAVSTKPVEQYVRGDGPEAWLVDIDGTLAKMTGRNPYDHSRYHEDEPNEVVCMLTRVLHDRGYDIVIMSGRDEQFRPQTEEWLETHGIAYTDLFMRPKGDQRNDAIVKLEMFWKHVAPKWAVVGSLDDRNRVVDAWRSIGLTCLQVAPGDF